MLTLPELLDLVDDIAEQGPARMAARRLAVLLREQKMNATVRAEVLAYIRAFGFVVRLEEHPSVQLPGVYDPQTVADDLEYDLSKLSYIERERALEVLSTLG